MQTFQNYQKPTVVTEAYVDFVDQLVARRHELGLTQERLAMNIGCTTSLIHKWEQYKRVPSGFMLMCWLEALEYDIEAIKR